MITENNIIQELKKQKYPFEIRYIKKNSILHKMVVLKNSKFKTEPQIDIFSLIIGNPTKSAKEIVDIIKSIYDNHKEIDDAMSKDFILENIHFALRQKHKDLTIAKDTEFDNIEAYLCIYCIFGENEQMLLKITQSILNQYDISIDEAWKRAKQNNRQDLLIIPSSKMTDELKKKFPNLPSLPVYTITNSSAKYGAANILNKKAIKDVIKDEKYKDWQIFMPSTHNAVLIPVTDDAVSKALIAIVKHAARTAIKPEDQLIPKMIPFA